MKHHSPVRAIHVAVSWLTVVPVPTPTVEMDRCTGGAVITAVPVVGALLGTVAAASAFGRSSTCTRSARNVGTKSCGVSGRSARLRLSAAISTRASTAAKPASRRKDRSARTDAPTRGKGAAAEPSTRKPPPRRTAR